MCDAQWAPPFSAENTAEELFALSTAARNAGFGFLAYLLEMARYEALEIKARDCGDWGTL